MRKTMLLFSILVLLLAPAFVFAGGQGEQDDTETTGTTTSAAPSGYGESPILAEKVAAGTLPPVEERLPEEPLVVEPWYEIGKYGGEARVSVSISHHFKEPPLQLSRDLTEVIPNVIKDWEYSADGLSLTWYLRKGLKWSDGEPVTADDFMFWWEDVVLNDEITPIKPSEFKPGGELMTVEKIDDYSYVWKFGSPYWNAHYYYIDLWTRFGLPRHALEQYHIKYNPDAEKLAKDRGYDTWNQLFSYMAGMPGNGPEEDNVAVPVLTPFMYSRELEGGWIVMERNPYYYQVDTEGNQLPYIDKLIVMPYWNVSDFEIIKTMNVAGDLDWENWQGDVSIYPILQENAQKGKYQVWLTKQSYATQAGYYVNQNFTKDPEIGEMLRDVRLRRALSVALNRSEINDTLFFGQAKEWQITCHPSASYFTEEMATAYAQYDPDMANELLDEMGLSWDSKKEWRLTPSGKPLALELTVTTTHLPAYVSVSEMAVDYWKEIGLKVNIKSADQGLAYEYAQAGNHHIIVGYWQDATTQGLIKYRGDQLRGNWFLAQWAPEWFNYYNTEGEEGLEPPEWYMDLLTTLDGMPFYAPEELEAAAAKVWGIQADKLIGIGSVGHVPSPLQAANGLKNIPGPEYYSCGNVTTMGLRHQRIQEWFWDD